MRTSRRQLLLTVASGVSVLSGCAGYSSDADTLTDVFNVTLDVVQRSSASSPAALRVSVENTTDSAVELSPDGGARPLEYVSPFQQPRSSGRVVLVPKDTNRVYVINSLAESKTDGCWRFRTPSGDSAELVRISLAKPVTVSSSEVYSITYDLYYEGPANECLQGTYTTTEELLVDWSADKYIAELIYKLDANGAMSADISASRKTDS